MICSERLLPHSSHPTHPYRPIYTLHQPDEPRSSFRFPVSLTYHRPWPLLPPRQSSQVSSACPSRRSARSTCPRPCAKRPLLFIQSKIKKASMNHMNTRVQKRGHQACLFKKAGKNEASSGQSTPNPEPVLLQSICHSPVPTTPPSPRITHSPWNKEIFLPAMGLSTATANKNQIFDVHLGQQCRKFQALCLSPPASSIQQHLLLSSIPP